MKSLMRDLNTTVITWTFSSITRSATICFLFKFGSKKKIVYLNLLEVIFYLTLGIKEKNIYECPPYKNKKTVEKFGFIYELYLETLKGGKKEEDEKRIKSQ